MRGGERRKRKEKGMWSQFGIMTRNNMTRKRPSKNTIKQRKRGLAYQDFVASVIKAMTGEVDIQTEKWIDGPDGRRDMDVIVKGKVNNRDFSILIECKDYDPKTTGKVGIELIDALDSKRQDVGVDSAIICSNSGFTQDAIRKAKRKHIGLISVLKAGDPQVKVEILEEIYTRKIKVGSITMSIDSVSPLSEMNNQVSSLDILYKEVPIINWVMQRISMIASTNRIGSADLIAKYRFIEPVEISYGKHKGLIKSFGFTFPLDIKWFSHIVTIDASLGIYDYIRGRIQIGPGEAQYIIKNLDIDNGDPIDFVPEQGELGMGLLPNEVEIDLISLEGLNPLLPKDQIPLLDTLIIPEDLDLKIYSIEPNN